MTAYDLGHVVGLALLGLISAAVAREVERRRGSWRSDDRPGQTPDITSFGVAGRRRTG